MKKNIIALNQNLISFNNTNLGVTYNYQYFHKHTEHTLWGEGVDGQCTLF